MATAEGFQELVVLFDGAASSIDAELRVEEFERLLAGEATLEDRAAGNVRAAYAQVGAGLALKAVVFFIFKLDARGRVHSPFNLPLQYMAHHAGPGPNLGIGSIRMACRSQCPIPWHALNLWEPAGASEDHAAMLVQKAVWKNRLGLQVLPEVAAAESVEEPVEEFAARTRQPLDAVLELDEAMKRETLQRRYETQQHQAQEHLLTATFGEAGRVSASQYARRANDPGPHAAGHLRSELERQQQNYLEQINSCRDEIQKLKAALRHEQERNRRLQQLLRGDL
ncbi:MAG: hypothetical protein ACNA7W_12205 [Pseudomonadales bacterium]